MASFYKRGKTWSFSIDIGYDKDGKRKKKGVGGFRTKKEAEEAAAQLKVDLAGGIYVEEKDTLFCDFANDWLEEYSVQVKNSTKRVRKHEIARLFDYFNAIKMRTITKKPKIVCLIC